MEIYVNGQRRAIPEHWQHEKLLFVLREYLGLVGAKFGCGAGQCGACTVHVDGEAMRSCLLDLEDITDQQIITIEGLSSPKGALHPVQEAWIAENVPQCGYCQTGQIMSAAALISATPKPTDAEIDLTMSGNLCRCGTYQRIRKAIHRAAGETL